MRKRIQQNPGDVYEVPVSNGRKGYFQYVMTDSCELDSDVIRIFERLYRASDTPSLEDILNGEIRCYRHVYVKVGIKSGAWHKVGNVPIEKSFEAPYFRRSADYGNPAVKVSKNWYVWKADEPPPRHVGELTKEYQSYDLGGVWPDEVVQELVETGSSSWFYPGY